jgi:Zn-dependent protease/predicted transcriptional regulator
MATLHTTETTEGKPAQNEAGRSRMGMPGSFRLLRLIGFDIFIHWSWLIIFVLVTWSLATGYLPSVYPAWSAGQRWLVGAVTSVLFFASVLAHELSHSVVARRRGLPVGSITLFVFGGVSMLGGEPRTARDEFAIAIVGPLTSIALAAVFAGIWGAGRALGSAPVAAAAGYLAYVNLALGIFNLLPGFPLDGGRVLRSAIWGARGSMLTATRIAANAGRAVAAILVALGVLSLFVTGGFGGVWFILIGWFLWNAAESSYQQLLQQNTLQGLHVADLIEPAPPRVSPEITLRQLVDQYLLKLHQRAFFVGPDAGEVLGLITLSDLRRVPEEQWETVTVYRAMTPRERLIVVTPETEATEALQLMAEHNVNQLPVVAGAGVGAELRGVVTRAALLRAIRFRDELHARSER